MHIGSKQHCVRKLFVPAAATGMAQQGLEAVSDDLSPLFIYLAADPSSRIHSSPIAAGVYYEWGVS